jgi:hypothetical protein
VLCISTEIDGQGERSIQADRAQITGAVRPDPDAGSDLYRLSLQPGIAVHGPRLAVDADVTFAERCRVTGTVNFFMSDLGSLLVGGECRLETPGRTALDLANAQVHGSVRVDRGSVVAGTLRLEGATVDGTLGIHAALRAPENRSLVKATAVTVRGDVHLEDMNASGGRISFRSATLGPVLAANARIDNTPGRV